MAQIVSPAQTSFNAGELSPRWAGRVDMAKYGNGAYRMRNFTPWPEGPANRRNGTRYAANTKNSAKRSWLARFVFSEDDSYVLEFGDGYVRFFANGGQVLLSAPAAAYNPATAYVVGDLVSSGGVTYYCEAPVTGTAPPNVAFWHPLIGDVYEVPSPYTLADLTNADGTCRLDMEQVGDVIFVACPGFFPRKLTRFGANLWTFAAADIVNGPFEDVNPDSTVTVYASAATGVVTLTASAADTFTTADIDTLFLLEQKKADAYPVWEVAKVIAVGAERRSDSNVYRALNGATTGSVKPTHREGSKFDGDAGVNWQYVHSGYGFARITAIGGGGTTATATVVSELPSQVVGAANATTKWAHAAWRSDVGFPTLVKVHRDRLNFFRGSKLWGSVAGSYEDFAARDGAETLPDSAYSIEIGSNDDAVWAASQDALLVGTRGAEFSVREVTTSDVFGPGNIKATSRTKYGSRQVPPLTIGDSTLMVQRSGKRVRDMRIDPNSVDGGYLASDLMVLSNHIARGAIVQWAFALEPNSIAWACCNDGSLIALTYLLEQDVLAWHPHQLGGTGVFVESVVSIPAPDGDHDQVWLQVRRTINGATVRTVEYLDREWREDAHALEDALFSDCALTFDGAFAGSATLTGGTTWAAGDTGSLALGFVPAAGDVGDYIVLTASNGDTARVRVDTAADPAPVTFITAIPASLQGVVCNDLAWARDTIAGLDHLEGEEVTLTVEGAAFPPQTVSGGAISLGQTRGRKAQIGLRADAELVTMRIEGGSGNGTSQGKTKRVQRCIFRLHETLGGSAGPEGSEQLFQFRSPEMAMDEAPTLFTGDYDQPYDEGYTTEARVRVVCDQPLPFTLVAIYPRLSVEDRT